MLSRAFWTTALVMLRYKRMLLAAFVGAVLSAACFGAGLGFLGPMLKLLLETDPDKRLTLPKLISRHMTNPHRPQWVQDLGAQLLHVVPADPFMGFCLVVGGVVALTIIGSIGRYIHEYMSITIAMKVVSIWRVRLFRRIIHTPLIQTLREGTSDNMSRLAFDTRMLATGYETVLGKSIEAIFKGLAAVIAALIINWRLALLGMISAPVIAVLLRKFGKRIRRATIGMMRQRGRMIGAMNESIGGIRVVKVHNAEGYERRRFGVINKALNNTDMAKRRVKALSGPLIDTLGLVGVLLVATIAAHQVFSNRANPADFMAVLLSLAAAAATLKPLSNLHNQITEAGAAAQRVLEVLTLPVEPTGQNTPANLPSLPRHREAIDFDAVVFRYPGQETAAVRGVSLHVNHGQTVAIVGGNGSGKTTLLSLLPRLLVPESGRIFVDGMDSAVVRLSSLRKQMAVVTQQSILFSGTIAQNIAYARGHTPREAIVAAAKAAYAHDFITALPQGYDTVLSEGGEGLSGGQKQRICIARAVLRDPAILILDEATSQIDADSEAKINLALRDLRRGRTTFIIAHRLSTVYDADLIVVMDQGQIVDQGTHSQLLERCPIYQVLTRSQLQPSAT
jgi:ABC-type multidrug transport system fused ATPase/permease subunit